MYFVTMLSKVVSCRVVRKRLYVIRVPFPHTTVLQQTTLSICCQKIENLYNCYGVFNSLLFKITAASSLTYSCVSFLMCTLTVYNILPRPLTVYLHIQSIFTCLLRDNKKRRYLHNLLETFGYNTLWIVMEFSTVFALTTRLPVR